MSPRLKLHDLSLEQKTYITTTACNTLNSCDMDTRASTNTVPFKCNIALTQMQPIARALKSLIKWGMALFPLASIRCARY